MSTIRIPLPPVPAAPTSVPAPTNPISSFLKHHETLLIVVLGFILLWFLSGKVQNIIAAHDNAGLQQAQQALTVQVQENAKTAAIAAQQAADFKALAAKYQAQGAAIAQANLALAQALSQRQKLDATLPVADLAARIYTLSSAPSASISFAGNTVSLEHDGAVAVVQTLEKVPVLTAQVDNDKLVQNNLSELLHTSTGQVATLNTLIAGKDAELKKADTVCEEKIKTVKDAAVKSKRRWFIGGFIAGFASRQAIKTYFGL